MRNSYDRLRRQAYHLSAKLRHYARVKPKAKKLRRPGINWGSTYVDRTSGHILLVFEGIIYCGMAISAAMGLLYLIALQVS